MNIEVVLTQDDPKLGKRGEVVKVSSGFAQNFLYPQHKAVPATDNNRRPFEAERVRQEKEEAGRLERARALAARLSGLSVTVEAQAGEADKLFGAVTSADIALALSHAGITVDRKEIHLEAAVKKLGTYTAEVKLHRDVQAQLKIQVVRKGASG